MMMMPSVLTLALITAVVSQQAPCPQWGENSGVPTPTPFPPPPASGIGSKEDVLSSQSRSSTPFAPPPDPASVKAAVAYATSLTVLNTTDCLAAQLQYQYSLSILPDLAPLLDVFFALRLDIECGATPPTPPSPANPLEAPQANAGLTAGERAAVCKGGEFHVYPHSTDPSTASIHSTVHNIRQQRRRLQGGGEGGAESATACVVLHSGVHYLGGVTVELTEEDSNLMFTSVAEESDPVWVSGGVPLLGDIPPWVPYNVSSDGSTNIWRTTLPPSIPIRFMPALNTLAPHTRLTNSQYPNYDPETETNEVQGPWGGGGAVSEWVKPALFPKPTVFWKYLGALKNDSTNDCYNHFSTGSGGPCALWKGKGSEHNYYCGNSSDGGWVEVDANMEKLGLLSMPIAMVWNSSFVPNLDTWVLPPLVDPSEWATEGAGPVLTVWQGAPGGGGEWYNNRFAIISHDPLTRTLNLSADGVWPSGGWQGGRVWHTLDAPQGGHTGPLIGGNWHVNGVFEELDYPGEYYFNASTRDLFLFYNVSLTGDAPGSPPPPSLELIAPTLEVFFNLTGSSPTTPIHNVAFRGLGFRDQRPAMLDPWLIPSGGDWGLRRAGALHLESTIGVTVSQSAFVRTDANAIMVSGYNRNTTITNSTFKWLGMTAIALLGDCDQDDCTAGYQPWGTVVSGNVFSELGIVEKQSSALFLAKTAFTRFENSLAFNGPRAMLNFNDLMGGHNITASSIFNTCRESGDHGPLNAWNRMPQASRIQTGGGNVTYGTALTEMHHNFVDAGYGGSQSFDLDDGSAFYNIHSNFFMHSDGFKTDYGGHSSLFHDNLVVVRTYDGQACANSGDFLPGYETRIFNNKCILPPRGSNGKEPDVVSHVGQGCSGPAPGNLIMYGNSYYTLNDNATAQCGDGSLKRVVDLPAPFEAQSKSFPIPDSATIIEWAKDLLGL